LTDPVSVLLKFAFLGFLYLFLLWVARSALKDLRRPAEERGATDTRAVEEALPEVAGRPVLVLERGGGLNAGASFTLNGGITIGRSPQTDIPIEDRYASGRHARIYERDGFSYIEDMGSTNGTYLNGKRLDSPVLLKTEDRIRIGDTEFRYAVE
jgi:pSer/pThr/pTyr-binding forkhead associated (FHA) protein